MIVPSRAVLEGPQGRFVYVVADNKAMPKPVQVGDQIGDQWIINQGLAAGDQVIIDGMARIFFPGAPVQIAQAPAGGASARQARPARRRRRTRRRRRRHQRQGRGQARRGAAGRLEVSLSQPTTKGARACSRVSSSIGRSLRPCWRSSS